MSSEKFIKNKTVLITLVAACLIVIISLGIRQTFGMFYFDFSTDLGITLSQFGFASETIIVQNLHCKSNKHKFCRSQHLLQI